MKLKDTKNLVNRALKKSLEILVADYNAQLVENPEILEPVKLEKRRKEFYTYSLELMQIIQMFRIYKNGKNNFWLEIKILPPQACELKEEYLENLVKTNKIFQISKSPFYLNKRDLNNYMSIFPEKLIDAEQGEIKARFSKEKLEKIHNSSRQRKEEEISKLAQAIIRYLIKPNYLLAHFYLGLRKELLDIST